MIYIAGDKHGHKAITLLEDYLRDHDLGYKNLGVKNKDEDMKLEDIIPKVIGKVKEDKKNKGILSCGTGVGVEVGANKFRGIRACLATDEKIAEWSVVYDNCNVLCLVGWKTDKRKINKILDAWLNAEYDGNERRLRMMEVFDTFR